MDFSDVFNLGINLVSDASHCWGEIKLDTILTTVRIQKLMIIYFLYNSIIIISIFS